MIVNNNTNHNALDLGLFRRSPTNLVFLQTLDWHLRNLKQENGRRHRQGVQERAPPWPAHGVRPISLLKMWILRVWLKDNLNWKGWNCHVHRVFSGMLESSNVSRDNVSREIGRMNVGCRNERLRLRSPISDWNVWHSMPDFIHDNSPTAGKAFKSERYLDLDVSILRHWCQCICYNILYYTILYYTILYYTILYYTILYYTILYYTILYYRL